MKKILIVEDDTNINNMIHEVLTKQGYECVQAFSGTEGLLYVKQEELLLVCNFYMIITGLDSIHA